MKIERWKTKLESVSKKRYTFSIKEEQLKDLSEKDLVELDKIIKDSSPVIYTSYIDSTGQKVILLSYDNQWFAAAVADISSSISRTAKVIETTKRGLTTITSCIGENKMLPISELDYEASLKIKEVFTEHCNNILSTLLFLNDILESIEADINPRMIIDSLPGTVS